MSFAGALFAAFAHVFWWALLIAIATVVAAWGWVGWQSYTTRRRPARATILAMSGASVLLLVALSWPLMESYIIAVFRH
ncbi:MAG: hypothetical protein ABI884_01040 [Gemmatimonadota bacterium]